MSFAQQKVLKLNKGWTPVEVITLRAAIVLLYGAYKNGQPKATIVDTFEQFREYTWEDWLALKPKEGEDGIATGHSILRMPKVIKLTGYDKTAHHRAKFNRRTIYRMYNQICQYCGKRFPTEELTIDHITPRAQGGLSEWLNCTLACVGCNSKKANRTPEQAHMKLLTKPHKPKYSLYKGDLRVKEWEPILGEAYWEVELQNDMK